jgi:hypothetical protein
MAARIKLDDNLTENSTAHAMKTVSVHVPDPVLAGSEGTDHQLELERDSQFLLTLKLFEMGRVSTSEAARMCGMASVDFLLAAERLNRPQNRTHPQPFR